MLDDLPSPVRSFQSEVAIEALAGLLQAQKTLPPKLFYDPVGCRLFQQITELPEYYLTRTELALLGTVAPAVAAMTPPGSALVEYGASDENKAAFLLGQPNPSGSPIFTAYVPIDVAAEGLAETTARLDRSHPDLVVYPLEADFLHPVTLPPGLANIPRLGFFPGSTIGNLDPTEAVRFLAQSRETLGANARMLIGFDLHKDAATLIPAYNDAAGITAAFNLNILTRLNRDADADFALDAFEHRAIWNESESRIEMHLISRHDQSVRIGGRTIHFRADETIHTENSYKYRLTDLQELASRAGWQIADVWTDPQRRFAMQLLSAV